MSKLIKEEILYQTDGYNVSERYKAIPSIEVINEFQKYGFEISNIQAGGTRSIEKALKQKHMIRMASDMKMPSGLKSEIIIHNSTDGTQALNIHIGMFRFACANGIVSGKNIVEPLRILHSNSNWRDLLDEYIDVYEQKHIIQKEWVSNLEDTHMTLDEAYEYASNAYKVRHSDKRINDDLVDPLQLLLTRRREDKGNTGWLIFNRVQEALSQGYFDKYDNDGAIRKAKVLTNIDEIIRMNEDLSDYTTQFLGV